MLPKRVYEAAKHLEVETKTLLLFLQSNGVKARSASSRLENGTARWLVDLSPDKIRREADGQAVANQRAKARTSSAWWDDHEDEEWGYYEEPTWVGPVHLTAVEAGRAVGVSPSTVRQWVVRGHLRSIGLRGRAKLYRSSEVIAVSKQTATRARQPVQSLAGRFGHPVPGFRDEAVHQDDLVDSNEAARSARVSPATIRAWVSRGHLKPAGRRGRSNLFVRLDVTKLARRPPYRPKREPRNVLK